MSKTICYWRGSAEIRDDIISAMVERNYSVKQVRTLDEVLTLTRDRNSCVLVVDGTASQREASDRIVELTNTPILFDVPIVFIATQAAKRSSVLKTNYRQLHPVDVPYNLNLVVRALDIMVDSEKAAGALLAAGAGSPKATTATGTVAPSDAEDSEGSSAPQVDDSGPGNSVELASIPGAVSATSDSVAPIVDEASPIAAVQNAVETSPSDTPDAAPSQTGRRTVEDTSAKNKERLRKNPDPKSLTNSYGGETFSLATAASDFNDAILLPQFGQQEKLLSTLDEISISDRWVGAHARRVAFVASAIANSLGFSAERDEAIRTAALLFSLSWKDGSLGGVRLDMFRDQPEEAVKALGDGMKRSGALIRKNFGQERAARLLEIGASVLQRETPVGAPDLVRDAQCVLLVELADRSCWGSGFWYPFGAYRTIRYLRREHTMFSDRPLAAAMSRVLGESVTSHVTVGNSFVSSMDDDLASPTAKAPLPMRDANGRNLGQAGTAGSRRETRILTVQITDLLPGMRLAQPLKALDGRLILDAQIRIDEEIVLQLWQLAAVRALSDRVAIEVEI